MNTRVCERWHKGIQKELHAARAVLLLRSAVSRESDFVRGEADHGTRKGILAQAFVARVKVTAMDSGNPTQ